MNFVKTATFMLLFLVVSAHADMTQDVNNYLNSIQDKIGKASTNSYIEDTQHLQQYSQTKKGKENGALQEASNKSAFDPSFYTDDAGNQYSQTDLITKNINKRESHIPALKKNYSGVQAKADAITLDNVSGKYTDCSMAGDKQFFSQYTYNCDIHRDYEDLPCSTGLKVSVKPDYIYSCKQKRVVSNSECKRSLQVRCTSINPHCSAWGLTMDNVQADLAINYNPDNNLLKIGLDKIRQWSSGNQQCKIFDRQVKFKISQLQKVTEFTFIDRHYDDYVWIKLNGMQIGSIGPLTEATELAVHCLTLDQKYKLIKSEPSDALGKCPEGTVAKAYLGTNRAHPQGFYQSCELSTNWHDVMNIDLKPYLQEGENILWIRTIVGGGGEFWGHLRVKQQCCDQWVEEWLWNSPECAKNHEDML